MKAAAMEALKNVKELSNEQIQTMVKQGQLTEEEGQQLATLKQQNAGLIQKIEQGGAQAIDKMIEDQQKGAEADAKDTGNVVWEAGKNEAPGGKSIDVGQKTIDVGQKKTVEKGGSEGDSGKSEEIKGEASYKKAAEYKNFARSNTKLGEIEAAKGNYADAAKYYDEVLSTKMSDDMNKKIMNNRKIGQQRLKTYVEAIDTYVKLGNMEKAKQLATEAKDLSTKYKNYGQYTEAFEQIMSDPSAADAYKKKLASKAGSESEDDLKSKASSSKDTLKGE
jgi:hypothetical protein